VQTGGFPIDHTAVFQAQLKPLGVDVQLRVVTSAARVEAGTKGQHHLLSYGFVAEDPDTLSFGFHSRGHGKAWNFTFAGNKTLDGILDTAVTTIDPKRRCDLYIRAQMLIMEQALIVPMYNLQAVFGLRREIQGFRYGPRANDPYLYGVWFERR
ncbi:MAG: hypothetical protein HY660_17710, partial [Armatimonadetes bacterium]|nr:hypothetical protein [Armatimonadota bacterium]